MRCYSVTIYSYGSVRKIFFKWTTLYNYIFFFVHNTLEFCMALKVLYGYVQSPKAIFRAPVWISLFFNYLIFSQKPCTQILHYSDSGIK